MTSSKPRIELHIPFTGSFKRMDVGLGEVQMEEQQFRLSSIPFVDSRLSFARGTFRTFDMYPDLPMLMGFRGHSRLLNSFIERVIAEEEPVLAGDPLYLIHDMIRVVRSVMEFSGPGELAAPYFSALIHELISLVVWQLAAATEREASSLDRSRAKEAHDIIVADFEKYPTVEYLARKLYTSEKQLQATFKEMYGSTVAKFSRKARMEEGYRLLETTDHPLRVICMMVGYDDPSNFSVAFRNHFGFWPGEVAKRKKNR
jgi:AraC-like DNA-binding protein